MKVISTSISLTLTLLLLPGVYLAAMKPDNKEKFVHFDFKTENGQQRVEDIKYVQEPASLEAESPGSLDKVKMKPVEYRGGYSFISADGYEYTVKYKANKNGFQPYVTAHKLKSPSKFL